MGLGRNKLKPCRWQYRFVAWGNEIAIKWLLRRQLAVCAECTLLPSYNKNVAMVQIVLNW